jgi:hypothetical protein
MTALLTQLPMLNNCELVVAEVIMHVTLPAIHHRLVAVLEAEALVTDIGSMLFTHHITPCWWRQRRFS